VVDGWEADLGRAGRTRVFIAHGRNDPIMEVDFARQARNLLEEGGFEVEYHESDVAHEIDPAHVRSAADWLQGALGQSGG
jgi:phospholipase/carboxylesterase